jgi:hypothetical protein
MWRVGRLLRASLAAAIFISLPSTHARADLYRALNLFGEVFEHIRAQHVDKPDHRRLIQGALAGVLTAVRTDQRRVSDAQEAVPRSDDVYRLLNHFGDLFEQVRQGDTQGLDDETLIEIAINGMLKALDPRSVLLQPRDFRPSPASTRGLGGIGVNVTMDGGRVKVVSPIAGSPADRAGISCGDIIVAIDGTPVVDSTLGQVVDTLRGQPNTQLTLAVLGHGRTRPFNLTIVREIIRVPAVQFRAEGGIGYIRRSTSRLSARSFAFRPSSSVQKAVSVISASHTSTINDCRRACEPQSANSRDKLSQTTLKVSFSTSATTKAACLIT